MNAKNVVSFKASYRIAEIIRARPKEISNECDWIDCLINDGWEYRKMLKTRQKNINIAADSYEDKGLNFNQVEWKNIETASKLCIA